MDARYTRLVRSLVAALTLVVPGWSGAQAIAPTFELDIPAGDANEALQRFYAQTHIEMLYFGEQLRGIQTNAVKGTLDVQTALERLLSGTELRFEFTDDYGFLSVRLRDRPEESAAAGEPSDTAGKWEDVWANRELKEVVVTGTLIKGVLDIVSPLESVTRRKMEATAFATVQDALKQLPYVSGGPPGEDSAGVGNFTRGVAANLRGLGGGATLVLIDGQRQPYSGTEGDFVDLSNIPWSAVERIEVLPDGASALYGSDAIAGVVNVITRRNFTGAETVIRYSAPNGGGTERVAAQTAGNSWNGGAAFLSYQFSSKSALPAAARAYSANADKTALGGSDFRSSSSNPGNIFDPRTLLPSYGIPKENDGTPLTVADLRPGQINLQNQYSSAELLPSGAMHSFFASGSQALNDRLELFASVRASLRDMTLSSSAAEKLLLVPSTNPFYVSPYPGVPFVIVGYNFLNDLGPVVGKARTTTHAESAGLKATMGDSWKLTLSLSNGVQRTRNADYNLPDPNVLAAALADSNADTAFNPFGPNSHVIADAIRGVQAEGAASEVSAITTVADGHLFELPSGPVLLAVGAERRHENFSRGIVQQRRFERNVQSAFAELAVPLVGKSNDTHALPRLELSLAGRTERFSDFGSTTNPKVGLRWIPSDHLKLRTAWGTSFRAPKLVDVYDGSQNLALLVALPDPLSSSGTSTALVRQGSNPSVQAETASSWTAGFDWTLARLPGFLASLTFYSIDYEDRVVVPGPPSALDVLRYEGQWSDIIVRDPTFAAIEAICSSPAFIGSVSQCRAAPVSAIVDFRVRNVAAIRARGIDLNIQHAFHSRIGRFDLALKGTHVLDFAQSLSETSPRVQLVDTVGNPLSLKLRATVDWQARGHQDSGPGASLALVYADGYADRQEAVARPVSSLTTLDALVRYRTTTGLLGPVDWVVGVENLLDRAPPFVNRAVGYDVVNADPYGRVVTFSLQAGW